MNTSSSVVAHCVIGPGRLGSVLLAALAAAGQPATAVGIGPSSSEDPGADPPRLRPPDALAVTLAATAPATVLWLTVPDDAVATVAAQTAASAATAPAGLAVVHCSGLGGLDLLEPWRRLGARVLSLHPLQTFSGAPASLAGVPIAVTATDEAARLLGAQLAETLGGRPFDLDEGAKPAYHLAAAVACNLLVALESQAADLLQRAARLTSADQALRLLDPLLTTTLRNVLERGSETALTGPVARGDVGTVRAHVEILEREPARFSHAYRALSLQALSLAAPRLDDETIQTLQRLLGAYPDQFGASGGEAR